MAIGNRLGNWLISRFPAPAPPEAPAPSSAAVAEAHKPPPAPVDAAPEPAPALVADPVIVADEPLVSTSDEGVAIQCLDGETVRNVSPDVLDARRPRLHVGGRTYEHVGEAAGRWLYRLDR